MTPEQYESAVTDKLASVGSMSGVGTTSGRVAPRLGMRQNTTPTPLGPLKPKQQSAGASAASGSAPTTFAKLDGLSAATGGVRASGTIGGPRPPWLDVMYGGMPKTADGPLGPLATGGDKGGPLLTPDKKPPAPSTPAASGSSNFKLDSLPTPSFSPASPRPGESAFEGAFSAPSAWPPKPIGGPAPPNLTLPDRPALPSAAESRAPSPAPADASPSVGTGPAGGVKAGPTAGAAPTAASKPNTPTYTQTTEQGVAVEKRVNPAAQAQAAQPKAGPVTEEQQAEQARQAWREPLERGLAADRELQAQSPDAPRPAALPFGGRLPSAVNTLLVGDHQATPDGRYVPKPNTVDSPAYQPPTAPAGTGSRNDSGESSDFYTRSDGSRVYRPLYARPGQAGGDVLTGELGAAGRDAGAFLGNAVKGLYGATTGKPVQYDQGAAKYRQDVQKWEAERDAYYKSIGQPTAAEAVALRNSGAAVDRSTGAVLNDTRNGLSAPANQAGQHLLDAAAMYGTAKIPFVGGKSPTGVAARGADTAIDAARAVKPPVKPPVVPTPAAAPVATQTAAAPARLPQTAATNSDFLRYMFAPGREGQQAAGRVGRPMFAKPSPTSPVKPPARPAPAVPAPVTPAPLPVVPRLGLPAPATTGPILPPKPVGTLDALRMFGRPKTSPVKPPAPTPPAPVVSKPLSPAAPTLRGPRDRYSGSAVVSKLPPPAAPTPPAPAPAVPVRPSLPSPSVPMRTLVERAHTRMLGQSKTSPTAPAPVPSVPPQAAPVAPPSPTVAVKPTTPQAPVAPVTAPVVAPPTAPAATAAKTVATQADDAARGAAGVVDDAAKPPPGTVTPADEIVDLAKVPAPEMAGSKSPLGPSAVTRPGGSPRAPGQIDDVTAAATGGKGAPSSLFDTARQNAGYALDPLMWPGRVMSWTASRQSLPGWARSGIEGARKYLVDPLGVAGGTLTGTADLRHMLQAPSRGAAMLAPLRNAGVRTMAQTAAGRDPAELTVSPHYDYLMGRAKDLYNRPGGGTTPDGTKTTGGFGSLYDDAIVKPIAEVAMPLDRLAGRLYHEPDKLKALADAADVPAQNASNKVRVTDLATDLQAEDYAATKAKKPLSFYEDKVRSERPDLKPVKMGPADLTRPTLSETVSDLASRATGGVVGAPLPSPEELQARAKSDLTAKPPAAPVPPPQPAEQQVQQFNRQYLAAARAGDTAKADAMLAEYRQKTPEERQSVAAVTRLDARAFGMPEDQLNALVDAGTPQGSTPLSRRAAEAANEYQTLQSLPPDRQTPDHATKLHAAQQRMAETERNYQGRLAQVYEEKVLPRHIQSIDRLAPVLDSARRKAESGQPLTPEEQSQLPAAAAEARQAMADVYSHALRKANLDFGVKSDPTAVNKNLATTGEVLREIDRVEPVLGANGQPLTTVRLDDKGIPHEVPVTRPASGVGKAVHASMVSDLTRAGVEDPKAKADDLFSQLEGLPKMLLLGGLGLGAVGLLSSAFGIGGAAMPIMAALGGGAALLGLAGGNPSTLMTGDFWSGLPGMLGKIPGAIGSALGLGGSGSPSAGAKNTEVNMTDVFSRPTGGVDLADAQRALQPDLLQKMSPQQAANIAAAVRPDQRSQLREYMSKVRPELGDVVDQVTDYDRQAREVAGRPQGQRAPVPSAGQSLTNYLTQNGLRLDTSTGLPDLTAVAPAVLEKTVTNMPKSLKAEAARQMERYVDGMITEKTKRLPSFFRPSASKLLGSPDAPPIPLSDDDKKKLDMARKVYGMLKSSATKRAEVLYGGKADGVPNSAFVASRLRAGRRHEREHTHSTAAATEIAKDHLVEDPQYYAKLEQLEKASFSPDLTPDQMAAEGVYGRMRGLTGPRLAGSDTAFADWYRDYHAGARTPDDDRQIARRRAVLAWHAPQFKKNPTPRRAFTLLNWATDPGKLVAPDARADLKKTMLEYRKGQDSAWLKGRSATT